MEQQPRDRPSSHFVYKQLDRIRIGRDLELE